MERTTRRGRRHGTTWHFVLVALTLMVAAACGSPTGTDGVASAGGAGASDRATASPTRSLGESERAAKFGECMRENGIDMEDPDVVDGTGNKGIDIGIPEGTEPAKVDAAMKACRQYLPNGGEPPTFDAATKEKFVEYAKCMRDNGMPDFPDPEPGGGFNFNSALDPESPTFQAADQKCAKHLPDLPGGEGPSTDKKS